ncbi:hypothetical protein BDP27DRAFT_1412300 [Rhodocollybia butyracea]|uniref:Coenzyme Q-binding protein COQ10 START domain-containing protein n=1 Tax=Rhodocollybia butyracea TaxID=206335 RepID=A0A9P5Q4J8_9AGAR|nr:hypothetical protein BDP27DRAFT_1412300 [Rhodocollybia butyracea]
MATSWAWGTSTPPPVSSAVFSISGSVLIDAPPEKAWEILMDFDSYKQWNPFVRSQKILNNPNSEPLSVGHRIKMDPVHLPPTLDDTNVGFLQKNSTIVEVTVLDRENHLVAWRTANMLPRWMLDAERWQMINVKEDGHGKIKCKYESYEVFKGILAYVVKWFVGKELKVAVDAMAQGIKHRAENN